MRYFYDLHIHSCLSPCADDDMTPANIAGMAKLNGLSVIALTDHNSTKNTKAFYAACEQMGIVPIAGIEVTTAEDIHLVGLFPDLACAEAFDTLLQEHRILYKNPVDIYGHQFLYDENDAAIGEEPYLLSNALTWSLDEAIGALKQYRAVVYPAHIDREANGMVSVLGSVPAEYSFNTVEIHDPANTDSSLTRCVPCVPYVVHSSDAHFLWDIADATHFFELEDGLDADQIRNKILAKLEGTL